jgi:hypothetical protein
VIASSSPAVRERLARRPAIADVPPRHLQHDAAASAVAAGVMPLLDGGTFQVGRPVSGEEAVEVIGRVQALASAPSIGASRQ